MNWIKTTDRLPGPEIDQVILYSESKYGVIQGVYLGDNKWCDIFGNSVSKVTHWTPLPDPPNESES